MNSVALFCDRAEFCQTFEPLWLTVAFLLRRGTSHTRYIHTPVLGARMRPR